MADNTSPQTPGTITITATGVEFTDPQPRAVEADSHVEGSSEEAFSIDVSGLGQLTGLAYSVSPYTEATIEADLSISAMSSQDVKDLNELAMGMLSASYREEIKEYEKTSASANLSIWSWFFGGAGATASYEKTSQTMKSKGLTEEQINKLMDAFLSKAQQTTKVKVKFFVNNANNDYAVSGSLFLYTVSGSIKTAKETKQYRMLADQAAAGGPPPTGGGAPATGKIIPLG
jgi:hypothetical protein